MFYATLVVLALLSHPIIALFTDTKGLGLTFAATRDPSPSNTTATLCFSANTIQPDSWIGIGLGNEMLDAELFIVTTALRAMHGKGVRRAGGGLGFAADGGKKGKGINLVTAKSSYIGEKLMACFQRRLDQLGSEGRNMMAGKIVPTT